MVYGSMRGALGSWILDMVSITHCGPHWKMHASVWMNMLRKAGVRG